MIAGEIEMYSNIQIRDPTTVYWDFRIAGYNYRPLDQGTTPAEDPCLVTGSHQVVYYLRLIEAPPTIHTGVNLWVF